MLYTLLNNDRIVIGPREWHQAFFTHFIEQELNIFDANLPESGPIESLVFTDAVRIVITNVIRPETTNTIYEQLAGPKFYFDENNNHIAEFYNEYLSIETIKQNLKSELANNRWVKETTPIVRDINGKSLTLYTDRETRSIYAQALLLVPDDYVNQWKFVEGFYELTKADLKSIADEIILHVQSCFDWESSKILEINNTQTIDELKLIILE